MPSPITTIGIVQGKGNDIGVYPVTFILADKRLKLIGELPSEFQSYLVYAAALMTGAQSPDAATEFIRFLRIAGLEGRICLQERIRRARADE